MGLDSGWSTLLVRLWGGWKTPVEEEEACGFGNRGGVEPYELGWIWPIWVGD